MPGVKPVETSNVACENDPELITMTYNADGTQVKSFGVKKTEGGRGFSARPRAIRCFLGARRGTSRPFAIRRRPAGLLRPVRRQARGPPGPAAHGGPGRGGRGSGAGALVPGGAMLWCC